MAKELDPRYSHEDLPPIKNHILYGIQIFIKLILYFIFGLAGIIASFIIFPILRLVLIKKSVFQKVARRFNSKFFKFFILIMKILGFLSIKISKEDKKLLKEAKSKIIIANHPSILDVVILVSYIPNADCVVRGGLTKTPLRGVINWLYIINELGYEELREKASKSLASGTNLVIFPEGTRTPRHGTNPYKRGAAHLALDTNCKIQPFYIGGNDKYGLGKHDGVFSFNHTDKYRFTITSLPEISPEPYKEFENQIAARRLTKEMHNVIADFALKTEEKLV